MSEWFEVFDHDEVLRSTRLRVGRIAVLFAVGGGALLAFAPVAAYYVPGGGGIALVALLAVVVSGVRVGQSLRSLQRVVWCVKFSVRRLVGYDYARRQTALAWRDVVRVDLDAEGLLVVGRDEHGAARSLRIPSAFPDFARLSHRIVEYAEAFDRPVYVDGRPWQLIDLHQVYPFLRETCSARGSAAR